MNPIVEPEWDADKMNDDELEEYMRHMLSRFNQRMPYRAYNLVRQKFSHIPLASAISAATSLENANNIAEPIIQLNGHENVMYDAGSTTQRRPTELEKANHNPEPIVQLIRESGTTNRKPEIKFLDCSQSGDPWQLIPVPLPTPDDKNFSAVRDKLNKATRTTTLFGSSQGYQ